MWMLWLALGLAEPLTVVAVGDVPLVTGAAVTAADDAMPGGWVSVVGDCLEESHPGEVVVIDRTLPGDTTLAVQQRIDDLRAMQPDVVVLSLGAPDAAHDPTAMDPFMVTLGATLDMLGPSELHTVVVGLVPGREAVAIGPWNTGLETVTTERTSSTYVDLMAAWPSDPLKVGTYLLPDGSLSARGHAAVGARVCSSIEVLLTAPAPVRAAPTPAPSDGSE